jgi:hypothetical protein
MLAVAECRPIRKTIPFRDAREEELGKGRMFVAREGGKDMDKEREREREREREDLGERTILRSAKEKQTIEAKATGKNERTSSPNSSFCC